MTRILCSASKFELEIKLGYDLIIYRSQNQKENYLGQSSKSMSNSGFYWIRYRNSSVHTTYYNNVIYPTRATDFIAKLRFVYLTLLLNCGLVRSTYSHITNCLFTYLSDVAMRA